MPGIASGRAITVNDLTPETRERIEGRVEHLRSGCALWTGAVVSTGYPTITIGRRQYLVRRVVIALRDGVCPKGAVVRASCEERELCVAPAHLHVGTVAEAISSLRCRTSHPSAALVDKIRKLWEIRTAAEIAERLDVPVRVVNQIGRNHTYHDPGYVPVSHLGGRFSSRRRLTARAVRSARARHAAGRSVTSLALRHGVAVSTMWEAIHGTTYSDVI